MVCPYQTNWLQGGWCILIVTQIQDTNAIESYHTHRKHCTLEQDNQIELTQSLLNYHTLKDPPEFSSTFAFIYIPFSL